jgi:hypothetical protein
MNSVAGDLSDADFGALVQAYVQYNKLEAYYFAHGRSRLRRLYEQKASALALAILRTAKKSGLSKLRTSLSEIALTASAQYYALAVVKVGTKRDMVAIVKRVEEASYDIRYWFQVEIGRIVERRMRELGGPVPAYLTSICKRRGFREDLRSERSKVLRKDRLPLKYANNRALYLRIVGHAVIGAAGRGDIDLLEVLSQHDYRMIARAAAIQLVRIAGDAGVKALQLAVPRAIERRNGEAFGLAVRDAEINMLGIAEL